MLPFESFSKAISNTKFLKSRKNLLFTFGNTKLPYIILANSSINENDTVIRKGEVIVEKPTLYLGNNLPMLEGFEMEAHNKNESINPNDVSFALMSRGIQLPNMSYKNSINSLDVASEKKETMIDRYMNELEDSNDSRVALIDCDEETWNLSLLHYVFKQVIRSSSSNIQEYLERYPIG